MIDEPFDAYAAEYDTWFLQNRHVLASELLLLVRFLERPGTALSVGCGSGLFEHLLRTEYGIDVRFGVEPAEGMAAIARKRGMEVKSGTAERIPYDDGEFDTVIFNGTPSYIDDLAQAFAEAHRVLRPGGAIVVADVPAESSYGLLYCLAASVGTWDDAYLRSVAPATPYPVEFAAAARWRTTDEKAALLSERGFIDLEYAQTLTLHPKYSNDRVEQPSEGYDRGDYVAIRARKA
jgi:ubiquinone/menaquinone biosynthesis C-methylase UbiE